MVSPPLDLIEIDARHAPKPDDYKRVSWGQITKELDKVWYLDLSVGRVFFRRLGQLKRDDVNIAWAREHPEFVQLVQDAEVLREFAENGVPLDPAHRKKLEDLNLAMLPVEKMQYLECIYDQAEDGTFVKAMHTMAELDGFLSALEPKEVDKVYAVLREMVTSRPITEESKMLLMLAQEFNIPLAKDLTADNMTAEMTDALVSALAERGAAVQAEMERMKR